MHDHFKDVDFLMPQLYISCMVKACGQSVQPGVSDVEKYSLRGVGGKLLPEGSNCFSSYIFAKNAVRFEVLKSYKVNFLSLLARNFCQ